MRTLVLLAAVVAALVAPSLAAKDPTECEVCLKVLTDVEGKLKPADKKSVTRIEEVIGNYCAKPPSDKETKLCYYLDPIKREVSNPMKNGVPREKICERLKKKSAEICALRYTNVAAPPVDEIKNFGDLRVKDLKKIMKERGIECPECLEKADFVRKLEMALGKGTGKGEL